MAITYSLREITEPEVGDHLCSLYETEEEHRALLTPFLRQGLERGEKVLYIVDAHSAEVVLDYLRDDGLEVEPYLASEQLSILTADDAYMREEVFDPEGMIAWLRTETERALAEGHSALRTTCEMTWTLRGWPDSERLIEYEARLNEFLPESYCLTLCQYDRRGFAPAVLLDMLCIHSTVAVGTAVCDNPHYIPPAEFLGHDLPAAKLRRWLNHLTERKRVEEALRESEEKYRALTENSPLGIFISDAERFIYVNQRFCEITGFSRDELLNMPDPVGSLFAPEERERILAYARSRLSDDPAPTCYEARSIRKDGETVSLRLTVSSIVLTDRRVLQGIIEDITGRKRAEEATRHQVAHQEALNAIAAAVSQSLNLKEVLNAALEEMLTMLNAEGGLIYLFDKTSQTFAPTVHHQISQDVLREVTGFKLGEGLSGRAAQTGQPLLVPDLAEAPNNISAAAVKEGWRSLVSVPLRAKGETVGVMTITSRTKGYFALDSLGLLIAIGNEIGVAIENAQLHQEVQQRVEELTFLNQVGRAMTSSLDLEQVLTTVMQETTNVLKVEAASIMLLDSEGKELIFETVVGPQAEKAKNLRLPLGQGIAGRVAREGQPLLVPDAKADPYFYPDIDQTTGFVTRSVLGVPLEVKGRVLGVIEAVNKIEGDFNQADVELLSSMAQSAAIAIENAQLYKALQNRMEELERAQTQLIQSAKLAAIGELAAGVAHELNNPLTSIVGFTSLLLHQVNDDDPMKEDLQIIEREADRTRVIVRGLLDFARQTEAQLELADVNELVQITMTLLRNQAKVVRTTLKASYDENLPQILLDTNQIKQVFLNIMTNAIQAMPQGGELKVATGYRPGAIADIDCVTVEFHDTGTGISAENLPRIFEPFFTTKEAGQGTGLGLPISHSIVKKHGGTIEVESEVGQGSTFTVLLPVEQRKG